MRKILLIMITIIASWLGWWIGSYFGLMTAFILSMVGVGLGMYFGRRLIQSWMSLSANRNTRYKPGILNANSTKLTAKILFATHNPFFSVSQTLGLMKKVESIILTEQCILCHTCESPQDPEAGIYEFQLYAVYEVLDSRLRGKGGYCR